MRDIFACRECQSIYEITRVSQPPVLPPFCRNCGCKFPPSELGDWLAYERAEPEWTVDAWLRGAPEIPPHVRYDEIAPLNQPLNPPRTNIKRPASFSRARPWRHKRPCPQRDCEGSRHLWSAPEFCAELALATVKPSFGGDTVRVGTKL